MKGWKQFVSIGMACMLMAVPLTAFAEESRTEAEEVQLTLEELSMLNNGAEKVYSHNGRVTFVDGTCSSSPVTNMAEAAAVVDSMMGLIGGDAGTEFVPWREVSDPVGNRYFIFQQVSQDTTVCGGAVKVITDPDGNMIALSSSVEPELPEEDISEGISAEEAQKIVADHESETSGMSVEILDAYTNTVILPRYQLFDINDMDSRNRLAWVVYTNNYAGSVNDGSDLPYLAHYVSMAGEYLYSMPAIIPGDEAGKSGYNSSYVFEFMEPAEYTGYVDLSDGTEKEITVTVMRDTRTGMYYLGNIERRILIGQCYDFLYDGGRVVLESSPDNLEWDQVGLLSLYNYCRAWDYYHAIGWTGGDGESTPILVLNNFCDAYKTEINNACYIGKIYGMQCFAASRVNDFSQCLDIIAHEFTHCVTGSLMTYNAYMNDYGAINEAMSDIQGKNCDMMAGDVDPDNWVMGANSVQKVRSMSDPHAFGQPEYTWDLYYKAKVEIPNLVNDHGGVHSNSSLLNHIAYQLYEEGGMSMEEGRIFWFMADCAMVPGTDYLQLAELLPFVLKAAGMEQYQETLANAIDGARLGVENMPDAMDSDRALVTLSLPETAAFDSGNWAMFFESVELDQLISRIMTIFSELENKDYSSLPESLQARMEEDGAAAEDDQDAVRKDVLAWIISELNEVRFSSNAAAGQDGHTLNLVVRPGRTIPVLIHMVVSETEQTPDQVTHAFYINGKWYDTGALMTPAMNGESPRGLNPLMELAGMVLNDILENEPEKLENIDDFKDVVDLFTLNISGGEVIELSAEGLDQVVIPAPVPAEEKTVGAIGAGKKSRPKLENESEAEDTAA